MAAVRHFVRSQAVTLSDLRLKAEVVAVGQVWLRLAEQADRNTSSPYGTSGNVTVPRRVD